LKSGVTIQNQFKLIKTIGYFMMTGSTSKLFFIIAIGFACNIENPAPDPIENPEYANWVIPKNEIKIRGDEKDFIPSIDNSSFIPVYSADHVSSGDLVLGISIKGEYRAYPVSIMNYHEVINEDFASGEIMISYCPLTGSSAAWSRNLQGMSSSFGISKFVYNSNHLLYDRISNGHWLPLMYKCVNGELEGFETDLFNIIETTWENWKTTFPGSKVLLPPSGSSFTYSIDPYNDYRNSDTLYYSVNPLNVMLPPKEKVHGIIVNKRMKAYRHISFGNSTTIFYDNFQGLSIVVVGDQSKHYVISFERRIPGGPELDFMPSYDAQNIIMRDNEGNGYDIFGLAVDGPRKGQILRPTQSISGYWFAVAAMYPDPILY
jgi:hypothetical protein